MLSIALGVVGACALGSRRGKDDVVDLGLLPTDDGGGLLDLDLLWGQLAKVERILAPLLRYLRSRRASGASRLTLALSVDSTDVPFSMLLISSEFEVVVSEFREVERDNDG